MNPSEAAKLVHQIETTKNIKINTAQSEATLQMNEIQLKCEHNWAYEPDPSGNNDSGYYCSGCRKWSRKRPK